VDKNVCIDCGLCETVCPLKQPKLEDTSVPESYIVQNKNKDILRNSTSGGFYSALSEYVISNRGVVFGAAFDENMILRHCYSETLDGCSQFRGSKYVQSLIGDSYQKAKRFLDDGRMVAFSGTPCQIAGLANFLGKRKYEKLILVDLVCHGTPSPRVLRTYLAHHAETAAGNPTCWLSRDKFYGYDMSCTTIKFYNEAAYHGLKGTDLMLTAYFQGLISRPSCYNCHFKTLHRLSDITLFDCWDAPSTSNKFSRDGATNVLIHTQKGEEVFDIVKESFAYAESDLKTIIARDGIMIYSNPPKSPKREYFFEDLNSGMSASALWNKYCKARVAKSFLYRVKPLLYRIGLWEFYMKSKNVLSFQRQK
jgi:coenzyme F420-reducing hydrogenase beta subunit